MNVIPLVQEKDSIRRTHLIQNQPDKSPGTMSVPSVFTSDAKKAVQCHQQYAVGEPVEAQYGASIIARNPTVSKEDYCKARNYSIATVFELNLDGTLHLHYSDGSSENHVYPMFVRPASEQARAVLAKPKGSAKHRQAECAYEAFLQSWDTAHADALKSHSQAIAKKATAPGSAQQLASGSAACAMSVSSLPRASMKRHTPPSTESAAHPPAARRAENASVSPGTRMMKTVACLKPFMPSFFLCWAVLMLRLLRSMAPKPKSVTPLACVMISLSSAKRSADSNVCTGSLVFFCCRLVRP